tara:strand:+ start:911 stop:1165 length:255 start_codon:yes stop_codon:yes gene_type:complete
MFHYHLELSSSHFKKQTIRIEVIENAEKALEQFAKASGSVEKVIKLCKESALTEDAFKILPTQIELTRHDYATGEKNQMAIWNR